MSKASKETSKSKVSEEKVVKRSAADFFQDNKAIAGFDNTMRVVFTSIRELIENGLDASERIGHLPELWVKIQRLEKEEIAKLLNVSTFESSEKVDFLRLTVRDNGSGIQSEFIPPLFGRVLTGSNYGARQSRGRFGLGAKMVLLNAMSSVDLPLIIKSKHINENFTSYYELMINLAENEPIILSQREIPQNTAEAISNSGTEVSVTFTGSWTLASRYVYEYFSQLSLITPYASFYITYPDSETPVSMPRVVEEMPPYPQIAKVHPWGTDITQFKRELAVTRSSTMESFLQDHFQGIGAKTAKEFLEFCKIPGDLDPKQLSASDIRRIVHEGFTIPDSDMKKRRQQKYFPFRRPSGESLSPLGTNLLIKGIEKELSPQFVRATSGEVSAYSGHPFIVEAALAYGGPNLSSESGNPKVYRFANRIPLLFGSGNDIITRCIQKMNWKNYKININKSPIAIVVSIVSSKVPFPETSKEYIADVDELRDEILRVLKNLARGLSQHLGRAERERRERQRQSRFEQAAPKVLTNIVNILSEEKTPFLLKSTEEISKLEKALASADARLVRRINPPSPIISSIGEWLPMDVYVSLVESNIQTIYQFLKAPNAELSKICGLSDERIHEIKRYTVNSQERSKLAPLMREFDLFSKTIEDDFSKYRESMPIHKALNKRWIVSSLDFFAATIPQLRNVENFPSKLLYEAKHKVISEQILKHDERSFDLRSIHWITDELEKGLKSEKILNILDYLISFPEKIATIPILPIKLIEGVKSEITQGIENGYIDSEKVIGAATFDWMDYRVTPRLRGRKISKIKEFMETPTEKLAELSELNENLIVRSKKELIKNLEHLNTPETLSKIPGYHESMLSDFSRLDIRGFIDFLLKDEEELQIVRGLLNNLITMKQDEVYEKIERNYETIPTKNAWWLDPELELIFKELGIKTIYDFISYPSEMLLKIKKLDPKILETIKRVYGSPIPFINVEEKNNLESQNIFCLEELQRVIREGKLKPRTLQLQMNNILETLNVPICYLPIASKYYQKLHHIGVSQVIDFLIWNDSDLHKKTNIPYKIIEKIKTTLSADQIKELIDMKAIPITLLDKHLKGKYWEPILKSGLTIQELYYSLPYSNSLDKELKIPSNLISELLYLLSTPISTLPQIKVNWITKLRNNNVKTFIDLLSWSHVELSKILEVELPIITNLFKEFPPFNSGMPLIGLGVFSDLEIKILNSKDYKTVEDIYFRTSKETFGVLGIKWKKIERFQRKLETPVAMLQLSSHSDDKKIRITHAQLEKLADNGIDQIIKFIYWDNEELKSIFQTSIDGINQIKHAISIKEQGLSLENIAGYNRKTISTLLGYGIETVEDLYFTASEDMLDEEDELDWNYVSKAIEALDLPLTFLGGVIVDKFIEKLVEKRIDTIIRFLITSLDELSEILNTPTENVENLKQKINLIHLRESTETSVSILEGLTRKQLKTLAEEQISTIFDFLLAENEHLAGILEINSNQVANMKKNLNFTNIKSIKEEKMVPLAKVSLFDKAMVRKLTRLGVESLADLYYVVTPATFTDTTIKWQEIQDARIVLDMPIETSIIATLEEIDSLRQSKIKKVFDMLMESSDVLENKTKIPNSKIEAIQSSFNVQEIITLLTRVKINQLNLPSEYQSQLQQIEVKTVYDLLNHPNDELYLIKEQEKKLRLDRERWGQLYSILKIPLSIIFGSQEEFVKNLKQKRIESLKDVLGSSEEKLQSALGIDPSEIINDLQSLNFSEISQFLNIPISFIPFLPLDWISILIEKSITRIGHLIERDSKILAQELSTSLSKVRSFSSDISMPIIMKSLEEDAIPLIVFKNILPEKSIIELQKRDITSIQELILHDEKEINIPGIVELFKTLNSPINRLSEDLDVKDIRKLIQNGISTLKNWYFAPNNSLAKLLEYDIQKIDTLKKKIDFKSVTEVSETDLPLMTLIEPGYVDFSELEKLGVKSLDDLTFIDLNSLEVSEKLKSRVLNLRDALNSSLAYYPNLPPQYIVPLALNGITSVLLLIKNDFSQIEDTMGIIEEEEYTNARKKLNLVTVLTYKKTESEFRVKLSSLRAFTPNQSEKLQDLGVDNVIDLYFRLDLEKCPKSLIGSVESTKSVLEKPVALLPSIQADFPQKILLLFNAGIMSIIEFLFWPKNDLAELLEIKRYDVSKYRKINLDVLKRKKNLGTPIENFIRIPENYYPVLHEIGIDNIEDFYFFLKRYPNLIPNEMIPENLIKACIKDLESPIVKLAELPIPSAQELVNKGINRIIEFLYWSEDDLKTVYGLSSAKIKRIKSNVRLRRKKDVLGKLDSYMGQS